MTLLNSYPEHTYTDEDLKDSFLIINPELRKRYNLQRDGRDIGYYGTFVEGSNFFQLEKHIKDKYDNEFGDSEGVYMAERFTTDVSKFVRKLIAGASFRYGNSKRVAYAFKNWMEQDDDKRIEAMRFAIKQKFDINDDLREILFLTGNKKIIEYTYWDDQFFGISDKDLTGRNILGKLLMEYRDINKKR